VTEAAGWDGLDVTIAEVADRLGEQRRPPDGGAPYSLSGVLNLVAYAPGPDELAPMQEVVEGLADHQASRTILIAEAGEGSGMDAAVSTSCLAGDSTTLALELVVLTIRAETREGVASACMPLLRSELPTVLWWPTAPGGALAGLLPLADRVVTEAGRGRDAVAAVQALADWLPGEDGPAVTDLAWAGVTPWRQLIVQVLDRDSLEALRGGAEVAIVHSAPAPDAGALLLAGWLRDYLGAAAAIGLRARGGAAEGVLAVEVAGPTSRRLSVERLPGRDAATVTVTEADGTVHGRTLPLPDHGRARLLAGELEIQRRDRAFERALARASR
jgi:glucose-6-phosphate dehydrogenase assembly protein OpcA